MLGVPGVAHGKKALLFGFGDGNEAALFGNDSLGEFGCVVAGFLGDLLDRGAGLLQLHGCVVRLLAASLVFDDGDGLVLGGQGFEVFFGLGAGQRQGGALGHWHKRCLNVGIRNGCGGEIFNHGGNS